MEEKRNATPKITLEDFAEVTLGGVLRAIESRKLPLGPIIFGIIWTPELGARSSEASQREARGAAG
jgi:hypothetical protein